jgi:pimeloyl-ACP methyl ester carboxylesterase
MHRHFPKFYLLLVGLLINTSIFSQSEKLVQVGNHKLFIRETGDKKSKVTVVFESGAGGTSQDWSGVIALLPLNIRTISYDRAGLGKSEAGTKPQTMAQNVLELHELLKKAKIKGPFIFVGQSIGGLLARLYTQRYPRDVQGVVLVDPTHESAVLGSMKYGGWVRLREKADGKSIPAPQLKDSLSAGYDPSADYMAEEFQAIYSDNELQGQALGRRPLVVLAAGIRKQPPGTPDDQWNELRAERDQQIESLAELSENSTFLVDAKSGHLIHRDNPQIVADAINMVIESIKSGARHARIH